MRSGIEAGSAPRHGFTHAHRSPAAAPRAGARQVQAGLPPALRGVHQCHPDGGLPPMPPVSLPGSSLWHAIITDKLFFWLLQMSEWQSLTPGLPPGTWSLKIVITRNY
jgi:hypothetical protein